MKKIFIVLFILFFCRHSAFADVVRPREYPECGQFDKVCRMHAAQKARRLQARETAFFKTMKDLAPFYAAGFAVWIILIYAVRKKNN